MVKQREERSVRPWDDSLLNNGYAKVNIGDKAFAVRIPKTDEIDFNNDHTDFMQYSNPDNPNEKFSEKANHGQGVLTGGVLLNLGVSREHLQYMVNNRDKPIEINAKEPTPPSNISPNAKIKVEGKDLPTHGYSTSFRYIPKSP